MAWHLLVTLLVPKERLQNKIPFWWLLFGFCCSSGIVVQTKKSKDILSTSQKTQKVLICPWNNIMKGQKDLLGFFRRNRRLVLLPFLLMFTFFFLSTLQDGLNYNRTKGWNPTETAASSSSSSTTQPHSLGSRYQLQQNLLKYSISSSQYDLAIIADMDKASKKGKEWGSILKHGSLTRDQSSGLYSISWTTVESLLFLFLSHSNTHSQRKRFWVQVSTKMEERWNFRSWCFLQGNFWLSTTEPESVRFLLFLSITTSTTCCSASLLSHSFSTYQTSPKVFEIHNGEAIPVHILMNGHGKTSKGFKTEWATVKDDLLYVGSTGKEWTADGVN